MDPNPAPPTIHVVVFRQAGRWVAQCVEVNIAVSAAEQADLPRVLTRRIQGQILLDTRSGVAPLSRLGPANPRYSKMAEGATRLDTLTVPEPWKLSRRFDWPALRLELATVGSLSPELGVVGELAREIESQRHEAGVSLDDLLAAVCEERTRRRAGVDRA